MSRQIAALKHKRRSRQMHGARHTCRVAGDTINAKHLSKTRRRDVLDQIDGAIEPRGQIGIELLAGPSEISERFLPIDMRRQSAPHDHASRKPAAASASVVAWAMSGWFIAYTCSPPTPWRARSTSCSHA